MTDNLQTLPPYLKDSTLVYSGTKIDVYTSDKPHKRDIVMHRGAVVILPIFDDKQIILIENERFVINETLYELPAGTLEVNEDPLSCAKRELQEETGYTCERLEFLTSFYASPGFCNEKLFAYTAHNLTAGKQQLEANETISVKIVTWQEALQMLKNGLIKDAKTIATLLYYKQFYC